jgi:CRP-like cAMP-binding protein
MSRTDFLKNMLASSLFHGLSIENMDELVGFAESKHYNAGDIVIRENDPGERFYWIESGRLEVQISQVNKMNKILVHYLKAGDLFGELALLGIEKRTATVSAKDPSLIFSWNAAECLHYCKHNKEIGFQIMLNLSSILGSRVRDMNLMLRNYADALGPEAIKFL